MLVAVLLLAAGTARSEPAKVEPTLPSPTPPPDAPPAPEEPRTEDGTVGAPAPDLLPIRARRIRGILAEASFNGLAGIGINGTFRPVPAVAVDAGIGFAPTGPRIGARGRFLFMKGAFSPWLGGGFSYGFGSMGRTLDYPSAGNLGFGGAPRPIASSFTFTIGPSPYLQASGGIEVITERGLTVVAYAGYSLLLVENLRIVSGTLMPSDRADVAATYGSGQQFGVAVGFSF